MKKLQESPLDKLSPRQAVYLQKRLEGHNKTDSALAAGYTETMANAAKARIENENFREAFRWAIQRRIPFSKLVERIAEGVDAEVREPIIKRGKIIDWVTIPDMKERREYTKLAVAYGDYYVEKAELDVSGTIQIDPGPRLEQLLALGFARRNAISDSERAAGSSEHSGVGPDNAEGS